MEGDGDHKEPDAVPAPMVDEDEDDDGEMFIDDEEAQAYEEVDESQLAPVDEDDVDDDDLDGAPGTSAGPAGEDDMEDEDAEPVVDMSARHKTRHTDSVYSVDVSPRGDRFATGGGDDVAYLWQTDGTEVACLKGHTDSIVFVRFSVSGEYLATGGMDGVVRVWAADDGSLVQTLEGPGADIEMMAWHPRGNVLLAGSADCTAWMWNAASGACLQVFGGHSGAVTCGGFTVDGKAVVTGSADSSLRIWNAKTGITTTTVQGYPFHTAPLTSIAFHPDGKRVMTGAEDGSAKLVVLDTGKVMASFEDHEDSIESLHFSESLPLAASAGTDGFVIVWDLHGVQMRDKLQHPDAVIKVQWGREAQGTGHLLYSCCADGIVRVWDGRTGASVATLTGHRQACLDFAVAADGSEIYSAGDDHSWRVFGL